MPKTPRPFKAGDFVVTGESVVTLPRRGDERGMGVEPHSVQRVSQVMDWKGNGDWVLLVGHRHVFEASLFRVVTEEENRGLSEWTFRGISPDKHPVGGTAYFTRWVIRDEDCSTVRVMKLHDGSWVGVPLDPFNGRPDSLTGHHVNVALGILSVLR